MVVDLAGHTGNPAIPHDIACMGGKTGSAGSTGSTVMLIGFTNGVGLMDDAVAMPVTLRWCFVWGVYPSASAPSATPASSRLAAPNSTSATTACNTAARRSRSSAASRWAVTCCRRRAARVDACRSGHHRHHGNPSGAVTPGNRRFSGFIHPMPQRRPPPTTGAACDTRPSASRKRKRASSKGLSKTCVSPPANSTRACQRPACAPQTVRSSRVPRSSSDPGSRRLVVTAVGFARSTGRPCNGLVCIGLSNGRLMSAQAQCRGQPLRQR